MGFGRRGFLRAVDGADLKKVEASSTISYTTISEDVVHVYVCVVSVIVARAPDLDFAVRNRRNR